MLTHYYEPEIGAPQKRWSGLVREFVGRGHSVAVCAPVPHYPHRSASALAVARQPLWTWRDGRNGERVLRVPYAPTSGSLPGQLFDQAVSAAASGVALMAMRRNPPDVVVSTAPGLPMPFAAAAIASVLRVPHVAEVRDAWPDLIKDASLVTGSRQDCRGHSTVRFVRRTRWSRRRNRSRINCGSARCRRSPS